MSRPNIQASVVPAHLKNQLERFSRVRQEIAAEIPKLVAAAGLEIQTEARRVVPVDYGYLRSSIFFDYRGRASLPPKKVRKKLAGVPSLELPMPTSSPSGLNVITGSMLHYATKVEKRTPYFFPAVAETRKKFEAALRKKLNEIVK